MKRSTTCAPAGTLTLTPTAAILPSLITTVPLAIGGPARVKIFAPVMNVYRVTVEQMAILEPALSETVVLTCMVVITEAIEEAVRHGVPAEAARQFILGHMNVNVGILFKYNRQS